MMLPTRRSREYLLQATRILLERHQAHLDAWRAERQNGLRQLSPAEPKLREERRQDGRPSPANTAAGKLEDKMRDYGVSGTPSESGWYATTHCWDPEEGVFPGAHWWTGSQWQDSPEAKEPSWHPSIFYYAMKFLSENEAANYANAQDQD